MTAAAATWNGRRGSVLLGPTEHRVARYLADVTRHGRVTLRTVDLIKATGIERSEAYRITARLRILGLFGIENDRGGTKGGRRYWRTAVEHHTAPLNDVRHRLAWSRIIGWSREHRAAIGRKLAELRSHHIRPDAQLGGRRVAPIPAGPERSTGPAGAFTLAMRRHGLGPLLDQWRGERP